MTLSCGGGCLHAVRPRATLNCILEGKLSFAKLARTPAAQQGEWARRARHPRARYSTLGTPYSA